MPNEVTSAEQAYLFRHAVARDAAYELHMPADRARLHGIAFEILEHHFGGEAPDPGELKPNFPAQTPHGTDGVALELAYHLQVAGDDERRRKYLHRAAHYAERTYANAVAISAWMTLADLVEGDARADCLRRAGVMAQNGGDTELALSILEKALKKYRKTGNPLGISGTLLGLSYALFDSSRAGEAEDALAQAIDIARETKDRRTEGTALGALAGVLLMTGRRELAVEEFERALQIHRETGNRRDEGVVQGNLGVALFQVGRTQECQAAFEQSIALHRQSGQRRSEGIALANLAYICYLPAQPELAETTLRQALAIMRETGSTRWEGIVFSYLGTLYLRTGRPEDALGDFERALAIHREVHNRRFEGANLCDTGLCLLALGGLEKARESWRQGAQLLRDLRDDNELNSKIAEMHAACAKAGVEPFE